MKITRLKICNFKSISPTGVEIAFRSASGLVVLVGKNNAGKSNILEAIGLLFGNKNPRYIEFLDDSFNDPEQSIVIEAEVTGLNWGDGKQLGLSDAQCGSLTRERKRVETHVGHVTLRLTVPSVIAKSSERDADESDSPGKQTFEVFLANHNEMKRNEDFRKELVKHVSVPTMRDHSNLLAPSTWTAYGHLLRNILADSAKLDELRETIDRASAQLRAILQAEATVLTDSAKTTAFVDKIDFQFTKDGNPIELLRNLSLTVSYGSRTDDISLCGTGTQSAVIIGVLELCLKHRARAGIRLFVVEEPELFLHPHAQRYVAALLRKLADESGYQVILSTHSASILAKTDMLDVVRVDRDESRLTRCKRIESTPPELTSWERILNPETAELFFGDRVVLVEGPSEAIVLPRIAKHVKGRDGLTCDADRLNVSIVQVGGKDKFAVFTSLLDELDIEWRIVADRDALKGTTLSSFKSKAGVLASSDFADQCKELKKVGVAILSKGEIEDYYPHAAIAEIAGCAEGDVQGEIDRRRLEFEEPTTKTLVEAVIREHQPSIASATPERLHKLVSRWYDASLRQLREGGSVGQCERKTGDVLSRWLKLSKPELAQRVAQWLDADPKRIPAVVSNLIVWLFDVNEDNSADTPDTSRRN